ncbi:HalOD1 output domain-containing protein [Haloarchaeobius sp. HRN-SO-5]|uniref:HalOD1 output domain-containing protein n=1 Tax=Haloarchaeobius sp. HRN-SO-5 TaxID=3446118 RepID=UPI003EB6D81C
MQRSPAHGPDPAADLLVDIVETLEACGLGRDEYQLYDSIDVAALERLLASSSEAVEVRFTVQGIHLVVTSESVDVLVDHPSSAGQ